MQKSDPWANVVDVPQEHPARLALASFLLPEENVQSVLEVDLDAQLHFSLGLLVLTPNRLLSWNPDAPGWQARPLAEKLSLHLSDHAGLGTLELQDRAGRLAC